jgi:hypothetical protein
MRPCLFLTVILIPAAGRAELIHFTAIHLGDPRVVGPRDIGMGNSNDFLAYPLFSGITEADIGHTLVATRETIGVKAWHIINGVLSNGVGDDGPALVVWMGNGGHGIGKECMFLGGTNCNIFTADSPWPPPNGIDLGNHHVDEFHLTVHSFDPFGWSLSMHGSPGHVPEPNSIALALIAICGALGLYHTPAFRRQWLRTASKSDWLDMPLRSATNCTRPE